MNYDDPFGLCPFCPALALAGVGASEEGVPVVGQVVGTVTLIAAGGLAIYEGAQALHTWASEKAAGQTAGGRPIDENGAVLGPSGKPMIHEEDHPTKKRARDAARNEGKGAPVQHPSPTSGKPHFHPTDKDGDKIPGSTHHIYPE